MDSLSLLSSQITIGAVASYFMQVLKNSKWFPWMRNQGTRVLNVLVACVTAAISITGISYEYNSAQHTLILSNISWMMIVSAAYHWLSQYVIQHGWYKLAFSGAPVILPAVSAAAVVGTVGTVDTTAEAQRQQRIDAAVQKVKEAGEALKVAQQK
jgi:hypothetical protein